MKAQFIVPGPPVGKQRPKVYPNRNGKGAHAVTPEKTVVYENLIRTSYYQQCGDFRFDDEMLDVRVIAYFPIPKSTSRKKRSMMLRGQIRPAKRPDADNILKAVLDACNHVAYHDDAQIVDVQIRKFYSDRPRVQVTISEVEQTRKEGENEQGA